MRPLVLAVLAWTNASAAELHCASDADCAKPSTCVERVCRKKPGGPVKDADRACAKDADCAIVPLECRCMYCARPGDVEAGVVAAANRKSAKKYEARCTREQQKGCATAGPCAMTGAMTAKCRAKTCFTEYIPRNEP